MDRGDAVEYEHETSIDLVFSAGCVAASAVSGCTGEGITMIYILQTPRGEEPSSLFYAPFCGGERSSPRTRNSNCA